MAQIRDQNIHRACGHGHAAPSLGFPFVSPQWNFEMRSKQQSTISVGNHNGIPSLRKRCGKIVFPLTSNTHIILVSVVLLALIPFVAFGVLVFLKVVEVLVVTLKTLVVVSLKNLVVALKNLVVALNALA